MASEFLINRWKERASQGDEIAMKCLKDRGLIEEPNTKPKEREVKYIKGVIIPRAFRPTSEVDEILLNQIGKGRVSKFINRAILETYRRDKREEERGG